MTRILLLGGSGGFGSRMAVRIAAAGFEVLVAGRDLARAEAACAGRTGMRPLRVDRDRGLAAVLAAERPWAVVDAAGPFQGASYAVARACLAAGCHYLDIADARGFVAGIGVLDAEARAAGLAVLSGASSVPALSGAVVRALALGLDEVRAVEIAITASSRAAAGFSVTRAILAYVGQPIRLWRAGRWTTGRGWGDLARETLTVAGAVPLGPRLVGLADVPDLDLLPGRLPGRPAVTVRAGTEYAAANLAMRALGLLVAARLVRSLVPLAPVLVRLQGLAARWGGGRSGMVVRVFGLAGARRLERRWTLVAEGGCGPEIPGLAVPVLLDRLRRGEVAAGARDAGTALPLSAFEPSFAGLAIRHETVEIAQPPPLHARVMGPVYPTLPPTLRALHDVLRDGGAAGQAEVARGAHPVARLIAAAIGFPPAGTHDLHVAFAERDGVETWTRDFGGRRFRSRLSRSHDGVEERFGPLRFGLDLPGGPAGLSMVLRGWRAGPLPLPRAWAPRIAAREWEEDGCFRFDVAIGLPRVGLVVRYRGWLRPVQTSADVAAASTWP